MKYYFRSVKALLFVDKSKNLQSSTREVYKHAQYRQMLIENKFILTNNKTITG